MSDPSNAKEATGSADVVVSALSSFLEEIELHDFAKAIQNNTTEEAASKLLHSLAINQHKLAPPSTADWNEAETAAVELLQGMVQMDGYLPRNAIKEISNSFTTKPPLTSPFAGDRTLAYPRYRAPAARPRALQTCSTDMLESEPHSPLTVVTSCERSEEYNPKRAGPRECDSFDPTDEYRDDDDPGYRVRDLWEAELCEEIQGRSKRDTEALQVPYYAAFTYAPVTLLLDNNLGVHHIKDVDTGTAAVGTGTAAVGTGTANIETGTASVNTGPVGTVHPLNGTPPRRQSVSSMSSHSCYVLNSTPPRSSSSRTKEAPFQLSSGALASASSHSEVGSQRCESPTFGTPALAVQGDDELLNTTITATPAPPNNQQSPPHVLSNSTFECAVLPSDSPKNEPQDFPGTLQLPTLEHVSPKSPMFGLEDEVNKTGEENLAQAPSQDELELCSTRGADKETPVVAVEPIQFSDVEETLLSDAHRWATEYSDGSLELHRAEKTKTKIQKMTNVVYPESHDAQFPIVDENSRIIDCFNLKVVFERNKTGFEEHKDFQVTLGSLLAGRYRIESQLGQAAFSKALHCYDEKLKRHVCMKIIRNDKDYVDQSLDEIKLLRYINSNADVDLVHCLRLYDFFYYKEHLIIVTELLKENLYDFSRKYRQTNQSYYTIGRAQRVTHQVLIALSYVHSLRLIHSDLKPENILMKNAESCEVKVIDFGSSCYEDDLLSLYVQSRSYRAPEVLLGLPYDQKIDLWSLGCIIAELFTGYVLFQNDSIAALLARVVGILGQFPYYMICKGHTVPELFTQDGQLFREKKDEPRCPQRGKRIRILLPKPSSLKQRLRTHDQVFVDFIASLLQIDPSKRPTAAEALNHPWLTPGRYPDGL